MVWYGQLAGALPEAMEVAVTKNAEQASRITAFRAIKAIGGNKALEDVRERFLAEGPELNREWLAELIEGVEPTEKNLVWILAALEMSAPAERYSLDSLEDNVTEFAGSVAIEVLPQVITGLNNLLRQPPMIERRYCEVSERFQWLMAPATRAVERLLVARDPTCLAPDTLAILRKISIIRTYGVDRLAAVKGEFKNLVPAWAELNRALFWFDVQSSRKTLDHKRGERLIDFWQTPNFEAFCGCLKKPILSM